MEIDITKLENVKLTENGISARCPACAYDNMDIEGNNFFIHESGIWGCKTTTFRKLL